MDLVQGLTNAGLEVNQELVDFYKNSGVKRADQSGFTGSNFTPAEVPASQYGDALLQSAKAYSDVAVVMFSVSAVRAATCPWICTRRATAILTTAGATWS